MTRITTYELHTAEQAVTVGTTLTRSWFRGHASVCGELAPRIFRGEFEDEFTRALRPALEMEVIEAFRREAPTKVEAPLPQEDDVLGWLYLMQHYRTPTRLLDWTQNILVALFFAVSSEKNVDGELWALFPQALNRVAHIGDGFPLPGKNPVLKFLIRQPYGAGSDDSLAESLEMTVIPERPVAFYPNRGFPRLIRQAGTFTIHPRPTPGNTIPEILPEPKDLVRYVIPAARKARLTEDLYNLGIDHYALFPEMEGLSKRIEHEMRYVAYNPPDPPKCAGPFVEEGEASQA